MPTIRDVLIEQGALDSSGNYLHYSDDSGNNNQSSQVGRGQQQEQQQASQAPESGSSNKLYEYATGQSLTESLVRAKEAEMEFDKADQARRDLESKLARYAEEGRTRPKEFDDRSREAADNQYYSALVKAASEHNMDPFSYAQQRGFDRTEEAVKRAQQLYDDAVENEQHIQAQIDELGRKAAEGYDVVTGANTVDNSAAIEALNKQLDAAQAATAERKNQLDAAQKEKTGQDRMHWYFSEYQNGNKDIYGSSKQAVQQLTDELDRINSQINGAEADRLANQYNPQYIPVDTSELEDRKDEITRELEEARGRSNVAFSMLTMEPDAAAAAARGKALVEQNDAENKEIAQARYDANTSNQDTATMMGGPDSADYADYMQTQKTVLGDALDVSYKRPTEQWTQDQVQRFYVLADKYGLKEASDYAAEVNRAYNEQAANEKLEPWREAGRGTSVKDAEGVNKLFAALGNTYTGAVTLGANVLATPFHLLSYADKVLTTLRQEGYYTGRANPWLTDYINAQTQGRVEGLNEYGVLPDSAGFLGGKGFGDMYQLVISAAQSAALGNMTGEAATLLAFFGQAADSSFDQAIQMGMPTDQAMLYSFTSGCAEIIGEKFSLEALLKGPSGDSVKELLRYTFKQSLTEGSEEAFTNIINAFGDMVSAELTNNRSEIESKVDALVAQGMSRKDAESQVLKEFLSETAFDALGGFFSGALGGGMQISKNALYEYQGARFDKKVNKALDSITPEDLSDLSVEDIELLRREAQRTNNQRVLDLLTSEKNKRLEAAQKRESKQSQEPAKDEVSFGRRLMEEQSAKEPQVSDSVKQTVALDDKMFQGVIKGYGMEYWKEAYEWALWEEEYGKADFIRGLIEKQGGSVAEQKHDQKPAENKQPVEQPKDKAQPPAVSDQPAQQPVPTPKQKVSSDPTSQQATKTKETNAVSESKYGEGVNSEEMDAAEGVEFVQQRLWEGRINNTDAASILDNPSLLAAFEDTTGEYLGGDETQTRHDKIERIKQIARNYAFSMRQDVDAADRNAARKKWENQQKEKAEANKAAEESAEADANIRASEENVEENRRREESNRELQQVRNSRYDSYVRGILLDEQNGVSYSSAREIASDTRLREAWERVTGKELPDNFKSAIKMIRQTDRSAKSLRKNDLYDTALDRAIEAESKKSFPASNLTNSTESGTIKASNTEEADNGRNKHDARSNERTAETMGDAGFGRSENVGETGNDAERAGQPAERLQDRPQFSSSDKDQTITRGNKSKTLSWLKPGKHRTALETGNWYGVQRTVKAGNSAIRPSEQTSQPGAAVLAPGTVEIVTPDLGTPAHFIRNMMDGFGVARNLGHIYNKYFDILDDTGKKPSGRHAGGFCVENNVAVVLDEYGTEEVQKLSLQDAAHECSHFRIGKVKGNVLDRVNTHAENGHIIISERGEYTYSTAVNGVAKALGCSDAEAKVLVDAICDYWLDDNTGLRYGQLYDNDGRSEFYRNNFGQLGEAAVQEALRKHVSEEFLVECCANGEKIQSLVDAGIIEESERAIIEEAIIKQLFDDGVLNQKQVDLLSDLRTSVKSFDFLPPVISAKDNGRGITYTNIDSSKDVNDLEKNQANRTKPQYAQKAPVGSEKSQYFYNTSDLSESEAESKLAEDRTKPIASEKGESRPSIYAHDTITSAADSLTGLDTIFEGGDENMPDVIAVDKSGRTYTIPDGMKSSIKELKKAVYGIAHGKHPMRSLGKLIQLYEGYAQSDDMKGFVTKEIAQTLEDIKEIGKSTTLTDNQKIMRLEGATIRALNLISTQASNVDKAFRTAFDLAKLMSDGSKSSNKLYNLTSARTAKKAVDALMSWQTNPTTLFKMMGNFDRAKNNAAYKLARRIESGTGRYQVLYEKAMEHFDGLRSMDGYEKFAKDKTVCPVKLGDISLTEQEAIDFIKRVTTLEKTVIGGEPRIDTINGFAIKDKKGDYRYIDKKSLKDESWTSIRDKMEASLSPVAKAYMEASADALRYLGGHVNTTKKKVTGVGFWTMDKGIYYPIQYHSESKDAAAIEDNGLEYFGPTGQGITYTRTRSDNGYVVVQPASLTVDSYIEKASNYVGYGDLANQLYLMDNPGAGFDSLSNLVGANLGKSYARAVHNYINDLNNVKNRTPRASDAVLKWGRTHLSSGALRLSLSVPVKQTPSYWTAMGILSPEAIAKAWRFKGAKAAGYSEGNYIAQYRRRGGIDPTVSDTLNNKDLLSSLKSRSKVLELWDNAITSMDYKTVDNLFKATTLDVRMKFPEVDVNSKLFADLVETKFQEVVLNSQPVYSRNARAEYLRTDDEFVRALSMFRTQQTQNLNQIVTAIGEYRAAKGTFTENIARNRLAATIAGQVASYFEFGLLSVLADFAYHKLKPYRKDEDDDMISAEKLAFRVALNSLESAAGTVWFADQATKMIVDGISTARGGDLNEFYGVSIGAVSTVKNAWDAISKFVEKPNWNNGRKAVGYLSQVFGVPLNNAYRAVNSITMYYLDIKDAMSDHKEGNRAVYDDALKMLDSWVKGELKKEEAKHQSDKFFRKGDTENLLYNIGILDEVNEDDGRDYFNALLLGKTKEQKDATKAAEEDQYGRTLTANERIANYLVGSGMSSADVDKAVSEYANTGGYNVLYDALRAAGFSPSKAVNELYKSDNKSGMTTQIMSDDSVNSLLAGKAVDGPNNDIPPLEQRNLNEYTNFVSALKVFASTKNYSEFDKIIDGFSDLDQNTQDVLMAKASDVVPDGSLKYVLECAQLGISSKDYYGLKTTISDTQREMNKSSNTGTPLKLVAIQNANLTDEQREALLDSDWMGISKTGHACIDVMRDYGMSIGEIGEFMNYAATVYGNMWGSGLTNVKAAAALEANTMLTDQQKAAVYEALKSQISSKYNDWGRYRYNSEIAYIHSPKFAGYLADYKAQHPEEFTDSDNDFDLLTDEEVEALRNAS